MIISGNYTRTFQAHELEEDVDAIPTRHDQLPQDTDLQDQALAIDKEFEAVLHFKRNNRRNLKRWMSFIRSFIQFAPIIFVIFLK